MKVAGAFLALMTAACGSSEQDGEGRSAMIDCEGIETCAREVAKLSAADRTLQAEFERAISRIEYCEPVNSTKCFNTAGAISAVQAEQRTWLPWRDAHCDVFAFSMKGTSAEAELRAFCRRDLAEQRTEQLKRIMSE
jgi:uncharacterized protein YecT (DUF1311 family)